MDELQKAQSKLVIWLNGVTLENRQRTCDLLDKLDMSVNQLNAQIKIFEMWKATNSVITHLK